MCETAPISSAPCMAPKPVPCWHQPWFFTNPQYLRCWTRQLQVFKPQGYRGSVCECVLRYRRVHLAARDRGTQWSWGEDKGQRLTFSFVFVWLKQMENTFGSGTKNMYVWYPPLYLSFYPLRLLSLFYPSNHFLYPFKSFPRPSMTPGSIIRARSSVWGWIWTLTPSSHWVLNTRAHS